jgi:pimeloyl-ACP methyl ester carboxylesterase
MLLPGRLPAAEMFPAGQKDLRSRFIDLPSGIRVRAVEAGAADAPVILLIPGWACSAWVFHDTIRPLADAGYRAVAVDLKGHGLSDKPLDASQYTTRAMRDHVIEIMDAITDQPMRLIGHSMGGAIAGDIAASFPHRVAAVAFVAPVGFAGVEGLEFFKLITSRLIEPVLPHLATRWLVRVMLGMVYAGMHPVTEKDVDEFWAPTQFPEFSRALRLLLHSFDWKQPFPKLAMPWMTIVGEKDHLCRPRDISRYAGDGGTAPTIVIPGVGHVIFDENPEVANGALMAFFGVRR